MLKLFRYSLNCILKTIQGVYSYTMRNPAHSMVHPATKKKSELIEIQKYDASENALWNALDPLQFSKSS